VGLRAGLDMATKRDTAGQRVCNINKREKCFKNWGGEEFLERRPLGGKDGNKYQFSRSRSYNVKRTVLA
jgi:hypothetical protein